MNNRTRYASLIMIVIGLTYTELSGCFGLQETTSVNKLSTNDIGPESNTDINTLTNPQTSSESTTAGGEDTTSNTNVTDDSNTLNEDTTDFVSDPNLLNDQTTDGIQNAKKSESPDYVAMVTVPIALIVGCIGNIITLIAMTTQPFNRMSWSVTLASLAAADTIVLLMTSLNKDFIIHLIGTDIRSINELGCKIFHFIRRMGKINSSWCVVLVCIERFIAICIPLKAKLICTRKNTIRVVVGVWLLGVIYCGVSLIPVGMDGNVCKQAINTPELKRRNQIFVVVGSIFLGIIPMSILLILTPVICVTLLKHARQRRHMSTGQEDANKYKKASTMLVSVHVAYIFLVLPAIIFKNIQFASRSRHLNDPLMEIMDEITKVLEELLNHSINFFLYTAFNPLFRKRLLALFSRPNTVLTSQ